MPEQRLSVREIFDAASDLPIGERQAYLDKVCGRDRPMRVKIEELLRSDAAAGDFLADPTRNTIAVTPVAERDPDRIGRYKILERVGEGGCGVVYVAEQTEPVRRRVALKVIKLGMDTKAVVARFEAERQALAMMDHPNIAKVLDGGSTEAGRPYFVMELVRGIKITDYCDQASLSTKDRLNLFIQVCQAIQHAHQKGIIHRDIKPSNILVTLNDGVPVPKVIDFGIAKATEGRLTDATVYTQLNQFIGTPAYMSPEQAEMSSLDIDTRSDIYSLGVLLYELLAGATPFDGQELMSLGIDAMRKTIREKEPVRPSTRLATLEGKELTTAAKRRAVEAPKLVHLLKGDLDWIVMKCLEKDRTRRYDTANSLAQDLERHLGNEPVVARPPTVMYRMQKLMRRNKAAFAVGAAIIILLLLGIAASLWQAARANREATLASNEAARALQAEAVAKERLAEVAKERDAKEKASQDAEAVSTFLTDVFQSPDPTQGARTITVAETLDRAAKKLESDPAVLPARRARLEATLAQTYFGLGLYHEAIALEEKVRDYDLATFGLENTNTLTSIRALALSYSVAGRAAEALRLCEEILPLDRKVFGPEHLETLNAMNCLAGSYDALDRRDDLLNLREEILKLSRSVLGPEHMLTLKAMANLANSYSDLGRNDEAVKMRKEALALDRKVLGAEHPETLKTIYDLAFYYQKTGSYSEAINLQEEALTIDRKVLGPEHMLTLRAMDNLANSYFDAGRKDEALKLREEVLNLDRKVLGAGHPDTIWAMNNLASSYSGAGRKDDAVKLSEDALALALKRDPNNPTECAEAYAQLGLRFDEAGRGDEAIKAFEQAVRIAPDSTDDQYWLGMSLVNHGRYTEALSALVAAKKRLDPKDGRRQEMDDRLALVEAKVGGTDGFLAVLRQTVADDPAVTENAMHLAVLYLWLGKTNERQTLCRKLLQLAGPSQEATVHDQAAKAYLIDPYPDPELFKLAVASARQGLALVATNNPYRPWFVITAGLADLRDARPAAAEELLTKALKDANNPDQTGLALAYRAIARAQLGRTNEARADFAALEKLVPPLPSHDSFSPALAEVNPLITCIAHEEAKALLNPSPPLSKP